jgi:hypothetical protein
MAGEWSGSGRIDLPRSYNNTYTYSLNVSDIRTAAATIGIDSGYSYVTVPSSMTTASQAISSTTYKQSDVFVTPFLTLNGPRPLSAGVKTQSVTGKNASVALVTNAQHNHKTATNGAHVDGQNEFVFRKSSRNCGEIDRTGNRNQMSEKFQAPCKAPECARLQLMPYCCFPSKRK